MGGIDYNLLEQKFGIRSTTRDDAILTIAADELVLTDQAGTFLNDYAPLIKTTDVTAAAAFFCLNFSWAALALQYSVSVWNRSWDLSLSNLLIQIVQEQSQYRYAFVINDWSVEEGPACEQERHRWREQVFTQFYSRTVRPLFERFSIASGLEISQLWGQLPTRFNYNIALLQQELEQAAINNSAGAADLEAALTRLNEDYRFLTVELDGAVFGRGKNPLDVKIRHLEDARNPEKQVKMKNVCCMYYKTGNGDYCYTCPRLKPEERQRIKEKLQAAGAH